MYARAASLLHARRVQGAAGRDGVGQDARRCAKRQGNAHHVLLLQAYAPPPFGPTLLACTCESPEAHGEGSGRGRPRPAQSADRAPLPHPMQTSCITPLTTNANVRPAARCSAEGFDAPTGTVLATGDGAVAAVPKVCSPCPAAAAPSPARSPRPRNPWACCMAAPPSAVAAASLASAPVGAPGEAAAAGPLCLLAIQRPSTTGA